MDGNGKEIGAIVGALAEIILAILPRGRQMRLCNLVRPIHATIARARLLNTAEDCKRRAGTDARYAQQLPAVSRFAAHRPKKLHTLQMQILRQAKTEAVGNVKGGRSLFRMRVIGVLRET